MIKEGQKKKAKYWGRFTVKNVAKLKNPVECYSDQIGKALFNPTLVKIQWENPPSDDKHDLWFPYWITINGREKYGQFAPMMGEVSFLELFREGIRQGFFSDRFLRILNEAINERLAFK